MNNRRLNFPLIFGSVICLAFLFFPAAAHAQVSFGSLANFAFNYGVDQSVVGLASSVLKWFFLVIRKVGEFVLGFFIQSLPTALSLSNYTEITPVVELWPVALGIANLGFLLALVIIALLTVLRLDVGGGVRRLLPRLLLAALLVNFSLILASVLIDFVQVLFATVAAIGGLANFADLPTRLTQILEANSLYYAVRDSITVNAVADPVAQFVTMIFVWMAAMSMGVVVFSLVMRYMALILLIIVSPFAYLFIAFPNTGQLAQKWWSAFLRYLFYGPVVLFILVALVGLGDYGLDELFPNVDYSQSSHPLSYIFYAREAAAKQMLEFVFVTVALFIAARAGKYAGVLGSAAAISVATKAGQRVRGFAYRGVRTGGQAATAPARYAARGVQQQVGRGVKQFAGAAVAAGAARTFGRAPGSKPAGTLVGEAVFGKPVTQQQRQQIQQTVVAANQLNTHLAARPDLFTANPQSLTPQQRQATQALSPTALSRKHVGEQLAKQQGDAVVRMGSSADAGRLRSIVNNEDLVDELSEERRMQLEANISVRADIDDQTRGKLLGQLNQVIQKVENKKASGGGQNP